MWLLGRLFERVEILTSADELTALERLAPAWWFHRHALVSDPELEFGLTVRENEWSLVERDTLRFGAPVLDVFLETRFSEVAPASTEARRGAQGLLRQRVSREGAGRPVGRLRGAAPGTSRRGARAQRGHRLARKAGISEVGYRRFTADAAVAEWMKALVEQGSKGGKSRKGRR